MLTMRFEVRRQVLWVIADPPRTPAEIHRLIDDDDITLEQVETALEELLDNEAIAAATVRDGDRQATCYFAIDSPAVGDAQRVREATRPPDPRSPGVLNHSFLTFMCPACGRQKRILTFFCRTCFFKLPWEMRDALQKAMRLPGMVRCHRLAQFHGLWLVALERLGVTDVRLPRPGEIRRLLEGAQR